MQLARLFSSSRLEAAYLPNQLNSTGPMQETPNLGVTAKLVLVRHGETVGNSSLRYYGRSDLPLAPVGITQMEAVARLFGKERFELVCSSPLQRAFQSAKIIVGQNHPVMIVDDFAEIDFGLFEGLSAEEIRERYPEHFAQWNKRRFDLDYCYPEGESRTAFNSRVLRGLEQVFRSWLERCIDGLAGTTLIVAHRGVVRTITKHLTGLEPQSELGSVQILALEGNWRAEKLDIIAEPLNGRK